MPSTGRRVARRARLLLVRGASLFLLASCAAPKPPPAPTQSVFVLLPDPGGGGGQITVTNRSGTQVLSQDRQASTVRGVEGAPSPPIVLGEAEIQRMFGEALTALPVEPAHFILYFKGDSDELTPESRALLPEFFRAVQDRRPTDVSIVGHTDTVGDRDYNYRLGLRRATKVADLLASPGADLNTLAIDSHGENDLLVKTGDQVPEPRNRRVEITVR